MKMIKFFLKSILFLAGVVMAAWFFMPWKQVGESVLSLASKRLQAPASIAYSTVGNVPGGFVVEDLEAKGLMGMVDVSVKTFTVVPDVAASLLNMAPTCRISFRDSVLGEITVLRAKLPGITLGNGRVAVSYNGREVFLEGLRSDGELSVNGSLVLDFSAERPIHWAEVAMDVKSEPFEQKLPSLQIVLPLRQDSSGRWFLRRSVGDVS